MKKIFLSAAICCLLAGNVFADFNWNAESGVWSDGANWLNTVTGTTGTKPDNTAYVNIRYSATSVCTLNTDEGLFPGKRLIMQYGQTWNIENGGRVGFGWSRTGRGSCTTINMSGNGAYVLVNDDLYIGLDDNGNGLLAMSDTSSITVDPATSGGEALYIASNNSTGKLKLTGSQVNVHPNEIYIGESKTAGTSPKATLEYVMDAGGASRIVTDISTNILWGTNGVTAKADLLLSAPGVTLAPSDIVLMECLGTNNIGGKGVFNTMNGGSAAEGTPIILGGNVYFLTYKYAANGTTQNDVALVFVRSAKHMANTPTPANQAVMLSSPSTLSWTNPDPNIPGNSITCKVYFGMDPNRLNMDSVTLAPNASTVAINATNFPTYGAQPLTNKSTYYWVVDCADTGVNPADGQGLFWKLSTDFNNAPTVDAGANQVVWLGKSGIAGQEIVSLTGIVTDDGLPNPYTLMWSQVSGPATVTISPNNTVSTNVTITVTGTYVFQLTADDTDKQTSGTVQVIVGTNSCHASFLNGTNYNSKDFNTDCVVNLADLADFVAAWLACTNTQEGCI